MAKKGLRLFPDGDVWVVQKDGSARASAIRNTKEEAWEAARIIAINQNLTVTIHGKDGKIKKVVTPRQAADNDCFITTACVKYYGLPDNCRQLQILRGFRDGYLSKNLEDRSLIQVYYVVAPLLVRRLEAETDRGSLFKFIFCEVNRACRCIEKQEFAKAKEIYINTVLYLSKHFQLSLNADKWRIRVM